MRPCFWNTDSRFRQGRTKRVERGPSWEIFWVFSDTEVNSLSPHGGSDLLIFRNQEKRAGFKSTRVLLSPMLQSELRQTIPPDPQPPLPPTHLQTALWGCGGREGLDVELASLKTTSGQCISSFPGEQGPSLEVPLEERTSSFHVGAWSWSGGKTEPWGGGADRLCLLCVRISAVGAGICPCRHHGHPELQG